MNHTYPWRRRQFSRLQRVRIHCSHDTRPRCRISFDNHGNDLQVIVVLQGAHKFLLPRPATRPPGPLSARGHCDLVSLHDSPRVDLCIGSQPVCRQQVKIRPGSIQTSDSGSVWMRTRSWSVLYHHLFCRRKVGDQDIGGCVC